MVIKMKVKIDKKIILSLAVIGALVITVAVFAAVYVFFLKDGNIPAFSEISDSGYDTEDFTSDTASSPNTGADMENENSGGTSLSSESCTDTETDIAPMTTETDTDIEADTPEAQPNDDGDIQSRLDSYCTEISKWADTNVPMYMYKPETTEEGEHIDPVSLKPFVGFYYMDIESKCSMAYNEDTVLYTASIIKAPYVMWVLREIEKAEEEGRAEGTEFDVNNIFVYTEDKYKSGSGIIQNAEYGTTYTYLDLLKLAVTKSDNVAFAEIRRIYGRSGFNEYSASIGVNSTAKNLYSASPADMALYLNEIYEYFKSGSKYAEFLKNAMLGTNHRIMIPKAVAPKETANKYGWDKAAYHDMAIVFDEKSPYLLVIMTELENGSIVDNDFIRMLTRKIDDVHEELFGG